MSKSKSMTDYEKQTKLEDDDDLPSEDEQEIRGEVNPEIDGNLKYSKDIRGYDTVNEDAFEHESNDDSISNQ